MKKKENLEMNIENAKKKIQKLNFVISTWEAQLTLLENPTTVEPPSEEERAAQSKRDKAQFTELVLEHSKRFS